MVVRLQEKKYSKVVIRVMILIYILKIKKKYMRNKRLLLKNKNLKLDRKIIINLKKLNIIKSIKCFKYWTVIMMDLYPKNILVSNIYLFYKYKLLLKFSHLD